MNRSVALLPDGVTELVLLRMGLRALRWTAWGHVKRLASEVERASTRAIAEKAGLLRSERVRFEGRHLGFLQYWSGFDSLEAWSRREPHSAWWRSAVERMRSTGDIAVYHEAFVVAPEGVESIYMNCPPTGLSAFGILKEPVGNLTTGRDRLNRRARKPGESPRS